MISCTKMLIKGDGIQNNEEEAMDDYQKCSKEGNDQAFLMTKEAPNLCFGDLAI